MKTYFTFIFSSQVLYNCVTESKRVKYPDLVIRSVRVILVSKQRTRKYSV